MNRDVARADLKIRLFVALLGLAIAAVTAVYTAPLMLERGWLSSRALIFGGSIGVTLWIGVWLAWSFARRL